MSDEVYTTCPHCGDEIPFYETVDRLNQCPECGTPKDALFDIAMAGTQTAVDQPAVTDGGEEQ